MQLSVSIMQEHSRLEGRKGVCGAILYEYVVIVEVLLTGEILDTVIGVHIDAGVIVGV